MLFFLLINTAGDLYMFLLEQNMVKVLVQYIFKDCFVTPLLICLNIVNIIRWEFVTIQEMLESCVVPSISHWGYDYFTYNDSSLNADCSYYKTYLGTLKMTCDQKTKTWITEGECQQYSSPLEIQDMRLSNGQSERDGRVELKVFDTWGTICENGFGLAEANVICHMIGFPPAQAVYGVDTYGQGTGPIFVDDLSCGQSDTHINNCTYVTYDDCTHLHDVAVKCT
ncbi:L3BPA-like protein, partial [Mya arenaria]